MACYWGVPAKYRYVELECVPAARDWTPDIRLRHHRSVGGPWKRVPRSRGTRQLCHLMFTVLRMDSLTVTERPFLPSAAATGRHAVVIGSGFGGLAAAIRLGARGYRVTVLEKLDGP